MMITIIFMQMAVNVCTKHFSQKDGERCESTEKVDFDQQTTWEAPIGWTKYTIHKL